MNFPPYRYVEAVVDADAALAALNVQNDDVDWDVSMRARQTASFWVPYNYTQMQYAARPFLPVLQQMADAVARHTGWTPNNCLLNRYPDGRSAMGWHVDDESGFVEGTGVAIVSLGAAREFALRKISDRADRTTLTLMPGSLLILTPELQANYQHALLAAVEEDVGVRVSATFRQLR